MSTNTELQDFSPVSSSSPSLPLLTKQLKAQYLLLDVVSQRLFKKVFIWLWRYIQAQQLTGVIYNYWGAECFRLSSGLTSTQLSILSYLYMASGRGVNTVRSDELYKSVLLPGVQLNSFQITLYGLVKAGYLASYYRDPAAPYLADNVNKHKIFIRFTRPGIKLMQQFEYTINYNTMRSSLAEIAERGKQGRTLNKKRDKI